MPRPVTSTDKPGNYASAYDDEDLACHTDNDDAPAPGKTPDQPPNIRPRFDVISTSDDLAISASLLRDRERVHGLELDILSVAARSGSAEEGGHATLVHLGVSSDDGRKAVRDELFTATARSGIENVDGSIGVHLGAGAAIATVEATWPLGDLGSVTLGATAGVGAAGSIGVRDADKDGKGELCGRVEYLWGIVGLCVENPFAN